MIASVHIADVGVRKALGVLFRGPKPKSVPGLRDADVATPAPLNGKNSAKPQFGRVALVAFWDDDAALDGFLASSHKVARTLADGWRLRLAPLRAHGSWPGLPDDTPHTRNVAHDGPTAVLTLARFKWKRVRAFFRASARAEASLLESPGVIWQTGMAKPPFVATCSLWESTEALSTYAYGSERPGHSESMAENRAKPFHHQQVFIRFRPYDSVGHLDGTNPLPEGWMTAR